MSFSCFRMLLVASLALLQITSSAQSTDLLDKLSAGLSEGAMEMTYSYTTRISGVNSKGQGELLAQGLMWKTIGNGVEMYCDSISLWVIDLSTKEVVIEPALSEDEFQWNSNPAVIFSHLYDIFTVGETLQSSDGKTVTYVLRPKSSESGFEYCNLELLKSSALIREATVALSDGSLIKIEVNYMKLTSKVSADTFRPRMKFDDFWIVTDLR